MEKLKLVTVIGTRPEIIRLSETIKQCDRSFNHVLIHTGQNYDYELNQIFFEELGLRQPDRYLNASGAHLGETIGNIISRSFEVFKDELPDALLILGDTNSALCAISAKRLKIPVFHMEAGNRCFDENVPEEINRKIVDHISDMNLPYTEHSRRYLLSEGFLRDRIIVTGSPMAEVLFKNKNDIEANTILEDLNLETGKYFVVSCHREENIDNDKTFFSIMETINEIADIFKYPIIYSTHPRSWKRIEKSNFRFHPLVKRMKPFGFLAYNKLQKNSFCVLSDSGTLSEESAILGFPAVLLRTSTERPEALDCGTIILGGTAKETIINSIEISTNFFKSRENSRISDDYRDLNVSKKIVLIIQSYMKIINVQTWHKIDGN